MKNIFNTLFNNQKICVNIPLKNKVTFIRENFSNVSFFTRFFFSVKANNNACGLLNYGKDIFVFSELTKVINFKFTWTYTSLTHLFFHFFYSTTRGKMSFFVIHQISRLAILFLQNNGHTNYLQKYIYN